MATLILSTIGFAIGGPIGGSIGAFAGRQIDLAIFGGGKTREGPRLNELAVSTSSYGLAVPRHFGAMRAAGQIIWATDLVEHRDKQSNGKGKPSTVTYSYSASFAVALSSRPITGLGRIWADGKLLRGAAGDLKTGGTLRIHTGEGDQQPDPLIAAAEGADSCPAYRGLAYVVFEDLQLSDFGNRIPALSFEIFAGTAPLNIRDLLDGVVTDCDADVPLDGLAGLSCEGPVGELLAALDPLYPADCDACDAQLVIRPDRAQPAAIALPEAATSDSREDFGGNAGYARKRGPADEQPIAVLRYYDLARDYQPGAQRAAGRPLPGQPRALDLPAVMEAGAARLLVQQSAARAGWARQTVQWRVTELDPRVRPGAIVTLPDHPGEWRVRDWEWRERGIELTLVRLAASRSAGGPADPGRGAPAADYPAAPSQLVACELPWDGNSATPVPLLLAAVSAANAGWSGASVLGDWGDGSLQPIGASGRARAVLGTVEEALPPASPLLFDRHRSVVIQLAAPDLALSGATMRQLAQGANRALLGEELVQFAQADPLGGGRWKLSGLWRGRGGTERAIGGHVAGEPFLLLDGTGLPIDPSTLGPGIPLALAAIGLADEVPVTAPILLRGIGERPLAPVHGRAMALPDGGLWVGWTRRARGAWDWPDEADTPLGESSEGYLVSFGEPENPVASWELSEPSLSLSSGEVSALVAAAPAGRFAIRQRGTRAISEPLFIDLP